jgi:hypothetical protein
MSALEVYDDSYEPAVMTQQIYDLEMHFSS